MFVVPQDGKPIRYPGKSTGSYSERLAALITREIVNPSDCVIELHGGEIVEAMLPYVRVGLSGDKKNDEELKKLADIFGAKYVLLTKSRETSEKSGQKKLRIIGGAGSNGLRIKEDVDFLTSGILNIAGYFNMIERQPASVQERIYMDRFVGVFSPCEGVFDYQVNMGDEVKKGSVLGVVRDYGGNVIAEIPAPEGGIVLGIVTSYGVRKGSEVMGIGPII
jgi:predicted deacylase